MWTKPIKYVECTRKSLSDYGVSNNELDTLVKRTCLSDSYFPSSKLEITKVRVGIGTRLA